MEDYTAYNILSLIAYTAYIKAQDSQFHVVEPQVTGIQHVRKSIYFNGTINMKIPYDQKMALPKQ